MFCPQCGAQQGEELKFCNLCGANLYAVRQVVASRETDAKIDWGKTWVAEMFLSESERKRRQAEIERQRGVTPEIKRYQEIKAGVITSCVGVALMIFLSLICQGIIESSQNTSGDNAILSYVWAAGVIPFMIGLALIFNGVFVSRKIVELEKRRAVQGEPDALRVASERPQQLRPADTSEFVPSKFSVTENTTKNLAGPAREQ